MKILQLIVLAAVPLLIANSGMAFETPTHFAISMSAAKLATNDQTMRKIGRLPDVFKEKLHASNERDFQSDFNEVAPHCTHGDTYTAWELIACGAMFEDFYWYIRPLNHFLDPQHVDANGNGKPLFTTSAAEWALQDHPEQWPAEESEDIQHFSYRDVENYLWNALTFGLGVNPVEDSKMREQWWGLTFQSLGQVIHLVQDMASPQHTRNEWHYDKFDLGRISQKSRYEQRALVAEVSAWIKECLTVIPSPNCRYNLPAPITPVYPAFAGQFQTPRSFWESPSQTGLAQVTSKSFPSNLRNFREDMPGHFVPAVNYPYPAPGGAKEVSLSELTSNIPDGVSPFILNACDGNLATCKMKMIGAVVSDPLLPEPMYNDRAASESLFDQDLKQFNEEAIVYDPLTGANYDVRTYSTLTINRFNIDRAYSMLIPRAVSYSAGLLNFYFRGEMSIKLPASGIYSIVDDSDFSPSNPVDVAKGYRGFKKIRLSLANTTSSPDGAPAQTMTNGKLWAILKFQRNNCYTDDLEGGSTYSGQPDNCMSGIDEIVVSEPIDRTGKGRVVVPQPTTDKSVGEEFEFNFPSELPINAWNILLQVVFRGTLGSEENKIAVSTVDISEPTFFTVFNNTDYVYLGGSCYTPQQVAADRDLWKRVSSACYYPLHAENVLNEFCYKAKYGLYLQNANSDPPLYTIANDSASEGDSRIPPKRFSRFAVLAGSENGVDLSFHLWNPTLTLPPEAQLIHINPYHVHKSRVTPGAGKRESFSSYRGVKVWYGIAFMMDVETADVAVDDGTSCIGGAGDSLPPLTGDARYPVPSKITFHKN